MGCDIHCYIEYRTRTPRPDYDREWDNFGGRINPGRNYHIFAALAGVRGPLPDGGVEPRGIPKQERWTASSGDWWCYVSDREDEINGSDPCLHLMKACLANPGDDTPRAMLLDELQTHMEATASGTANFQMNYCTAEQAERWAKEYGIKTEKRDGKIVKVEHPDWHTPSWLTPDEWALALRLAEIGSTQEPKYQAMLAAMRCLENLGNEVRVVFWFDN